MVETNHSPTIRSLVFAGLSITVFVFILSRMSFFPYSEMLTETYFQKIGMLPYTQINDQHFPGLFLLPINLQSLGFDSVIKLRWLHLGLMVINSLLIYFLTKKQLAVITYLVFFAIWEGNTLWVDSFVATLALIGFISLYSKWVFKNLLTHFLTGLIFGLSLMFKQHGILLCLVAGVWVLAQRPKLLHLVGFLLGGALPMGIAVLYLYVLGVWNDFWFWTVAHNLTGYIGLEGRWPMMGELARFLLLLIPSYFGLTQILPRLKAVLVGSFALAAAIYIFPRFGLIHAQVLLPILIFLVSKTVKLNWLVLAAGLIFLSRIGAKDIPGKVYFYDQATESTVEYVRQNATLNRPIYTYGVNDNIYHLTSTRPPQWIWIELLKGNMIAGVEDTLINSLYLDPPQFILVDPYAQIDGEKISEFTPKLWQYISGRYKLKVSLKNGIQVWYVN